MDTYHLWFDLRTGVKDLDLANAIKDMMEHMKAEGLIEAYRLQRCKLGFRPDGTKEWWVGIDTKDMAQLEQAFQTVRPRSGNMERMHAAVWSKVEGLRTGLWRDFPDR